MKLKIEKRIKACREVLPGVGIGFVSDYSNTNFPLYIEYIEKDEDGNYNFGDSKDMIAYGKWRKYLMRIDYPEGGKILEKMEKEIEKLNNK